MTKTMRAYKAKVLSTVCDWVDGKSIDEFGYAILLWPAPRPQQFAKIDIITGEVTRFVRQSGTQYQDAPPDLTVIDRRLSYLAERHREALAELKKKDKEKT